jgi:hypothetical protein
MTEKFIMISAVSMSCANCKKHIGSLMMEKSDREKVTDVLEGTRTYVLCPDCHIFIKKPRPDDTIIER